MGKIDDFPDATVYVCTVHEMPSFGASAREMIEAPASCDRCRIRVDAPTTGRVMDECSRCGGHLRSLPTDGTKGGEASDER